MANTKTKDELNNLAYCDVLEDKKASMPDNEYYMKCYDYWNFLKKTMPYRKEN